MEHSYQQASDDLLVLLSSVKRIAGTIAEEQQLTRVQLFALYSLYLKDEIAMGKVADELHCDASNVTGIVDRLVSRQLVVRKECVRDRRTKTLTLTAKGKAIVELTKKELPVRLGCANLSEKQRVDLHEIIHSLSV